MKLVKSKIDDGFTDVVQQLRGLREEKQLSQPALDHSLGVTRGGVGKWETGTRRPSSYLLSCWAKALGARITLENETNDEDETQLSA